MYLDISLLAEDGTTTDLNVCLADGSIWLRGRCILRLIPRLDHDFWGDEVQYVFLRDASPIAEPLNVQLLELICRHNPAIVKIIHNQGEWN